MGCYVMNKERTENKQFLSVKEISQYMGLSIHTIYLWVQLRKIPYYKIGKAVRFNLQEINEWLKAQHIRTMEL